MSTLFTHVTALPMDDGLTTLQDGFVAVEGTHIAYVARSGRRAAMTSSSTAPAR